MLSLPQTFKLDSALANGEASAGKAFSLAAGSTAEGSGFSDTLRATQPRRATTATGADAAGGRLPADGKSLPPPRDLPASGPIKSPAGGPDKSPADTALPVTGPVKRAESLPPGVALIERTPSGELPVLSVAQLARRAAGAPGQADFMAMAADGAATVEPVAVEVSPAPRAAPDLPGLPELPLAAAYKLAPGGQPAQGLALTALNNGSRNALPDSLSGSLPGAPGGAAGRATALPVTTPYQGIDVSLMRNSAAAPDAAAAVQLAPLAAGTSEQSLRSAALVPDLMQAPNGQPPSSLQRPDPLRTLPQGRPVQATPAGPLAAPPPVAVSPASLGAAGIIGAAPPLPKEPPLPAPLPTIAAASLQPDRTAQNLARGAQASPALAATPQLAEAARAVSDAMQLAQPAPQQDIAVNAAAVQARGDAAPVAAAFAPAGQDLFTTPTMTALRNTAARAASASVAAGGAQPGSEPLVTAKSDLPTTLAPQAGFAALAPAPAPSAAATVATAPPAVQSLPMPVTDNAWGKALGERVAVLAGQKITSAEIRLNPAELGPLRVEIKVDDGNAQVHFTALHAVTREAIEQALPRLRELLSAEGLNLTGANVSEQGVRRDAGGQEQAGGQQGTLAGTEATADASAGDSVAAAKPGKGLVDTFA